MQHEVNQSIIVQKFIVALAKKSSKASLYEKIDQFLKHQIAFIVNHIYEFVSNTCILGQTIQLLGLYIKIFEHFFR